MDTPATPSEGVVIATFEKNKKEEVRLSVETFHGRKLINLRVFYKDDDGTMKPGKQGMALGVDRYKDLAGAILQVGEHLKANGLL
ncbi:MAG TPA: transcriptional coactivator p15/PC4 family protein [Candidatus Dormibacteraeota bacterium]|nr:transcriptional coactivator p15/PC4 family protein [Candidatus Dormibacteraeota bacterium]